MRPGVVRVSGANVTPPQSRGLPPFLLYYSKHAVFILRLPQDGRMNAIATAVPFIFRRAARERITNAKENTV